MKKRKNSQRYFEIDALRGLAILMVILIHTNAYFLNNKTAFLLWDLNQWAVPAFIFCSAYVYLKKDVLIKNFPDFFNHVKKRFVRLLRPYYLFAVVYFILIFLQEPKKLTADYIFQSLAVVGGIDINWLVLLFLAFAILMPIIHYLAEKKKLFFYSYSGIALISSLFLIFYNFPGNYRLIMWLPWSLLIIFSLYLAKYESKNKFIVGGALVSLMIFFVLRLTEISIHRSLTMFNNKYPPNLYHIGYGMFLVLLIYFAAKNNVFNFSPIKRILTFLSRYSYSLFFVHWIVIYVLTIYLKWRFTWITFFIWTLSVSVLIQFFINVFQHYIKARRFGYWPARAN